MLGYVTEEVVVADKLYPVITTLRSHIAGKRLETVCVSPWAPLLKVLTNTYQCSVQIGGERVVGSREIVFRCQTLLQPHHRSACGSHFSVWLQFFTVPGNINQYSLREGC